MNVTVLGGLAACGCVTALALALAGCGSGTGSGPVAAAKAPSWAVSLGSGVTVEAPTRTPSRGSPQAVMAAYVRALDAGNFNGACAYVVLSDQAACKSVIADAGGQLAMPSGAIYDGFSLGYTVIADTQALVGATGKLCVVTQAQNCVANSDPAAVLDSGKSFGTLWQQALNAPPNAYSPVPCVRINGSWYLDTPGT
jgi:hypothetical protein